MDDPPDFLKVEFLQKKFFKLTKNKCDINSIIEYIKTEKFMNHDQSIKDFLLSVTLFFNSNMISNDTVKELLIPFFDNLSSFFSRKALFSLFTSADKYFILQLINLHMVNFNQNIKKGQPLTVLRYFSPEYGYTYQNTTKEIFSDSNEFLEMRNLGHTKDPLCKAIREDDFEQFLFIISNSTTDINNLSVQISLFERFAIFESDHISVIKYAAFFGAIKIFKYLLMNLSFLEDDLPKYAVAGGNFDIIHLCEEKKLSFDQCINFAIEYNRKEIVNYLLENYDLNEKSIKIAINSFNCKALKVILDNIISNNNENLIKKTILNTIINGNITIFRYINKLGLNEKMKEFLFLMVKQNRFEIFKIAITSFIKENEDLQFLNDVNTKFQGRLIDYALKHDMNIFEYLCSFDIIDLNKSSESDHPPPIITIVEKNRTDLFIFLVSNKDIELNSENENGETPLHIASKKGNLEIVKTIMSLSSVNVDRQTNLLMTPLHFAAKEGHFDIVQFLVNSCNATKTLKDIKGVLLYYLSNSI